MGYKNIFSKELDLNRGLTGVEICTDNMPFSLPQLLRNLMQY